MPKLTQERSIWLLILILCLPAAWFGGFWMAKHSDSVLKPAKQFGYVQLKAACEKQTDGQIEHYKNTWHEDTKECEGYEVSKWCEPNGGEFVNKNICPPGKFCTLQLRKNICRFK